MSIENPATLPFQKTTTYEELLEDILLQIVDHTYDLRVSQIDDGDVLHFHVVSNQKDRGRIIGRQGSIIGSLHKLFATMNRGKPVKIDVVEE